MKHQEHDPHDAWANALLEARTARRRTRTPGPPATCIAREDPSFRRRATTDPSTARRAVSGIAIRTTACHGVTGKLAPPAAR